MYFGYQMHFRKYNLLIGVIGVMAVMSVLAVLAVLAVAVRLVLR